MEKVENQEEGVYHIYAGMLMEDNGDGCFFTCTSKLMTRERNKEREKVDNQEEGVYHIYAGMRMEDNGDGCFFIYTIKLMEREKKEG